MNIKHLAISLVVFLGIQFSFADEAKRKAVLVTGASSGSGKVIAETLALKGYYVYAGARKQKDLDALNAIDNIHALKLDVTIQSEIDAAVKEVERTGHGLYGLVNNAGIAILGPLIETEESDLKYLFEVNVYGPFRITKAFAPILIESKGRISTIGSVSGINSAPFYGPYRMSKHAIEAFNDSLALEMEKFDVKVSIIEPSGFSSKLAAATYQRLVKSGFDFEQSRYQPEWESNWLLKNSGKSNINNNIPEKIAAAVIDTLESEKPKSRYLIVDEKAIAVEVVEQAMLEMLQLNHKHPYAMNKSELINILESLFDKDLSENPFSWD